MRKYLLAVFLIISIANGYSQKDSLTRENKDTVDEKYDRVYKLFIKDEDKEIKHLWKINVVDLGLLMPNLGYEQKIKKWLSYDTYIKIGFDWWDNYSKFIPKWEVNQFLKIYYSVNRRERLGKKTNGFTGSYIAVGLLGGERQDPKPALHEGYIISANLYYGAGMYYGFQRRIGNIGYFEIIGGINYLHQNQSEYKKNNTILCDFLYPEKSSAWRDIPVIRIKAGFAIDSFVKNKILK
jgi:hypothetical protein